MPDREDIVAAVEQYVRHLGEHDVDQLVSLFADDAVQHEPLGVASYRGIEEIRAFDARNARMPFTVERMAPIVVSGRHASTGARIRMGEHDFAAMEMFEFDDECKIVSLSVLIDQEARW